MARERLVRIAALLHVGHDDLIELETLGKGDVEQHHAMIGYGLLASRNDDGKPSEHVLELGHAAGVRCDDRRQAAVLERLLDRRAQLCRVIDIVGAFDDDRIGSRRLDGFDPHALLVVEQAREQGRYLRR